MSEVKYLPAPGLHLALARATGVHLNVCRKWLTKPPQRHAAHVGYKLTRGLIALGAELPPWLLPYKVAIDTAESAVKS